MADQVVNIDVSFGGGGRVRITSVRRLGPVLSMRLYGLCRALGSQSLWRPIIELILKGQVVVSGSIRGGGEGKFWNEMVLIVMSCRHRLRLTVRALVRCCGLMCIR